MTHGVSLHMYVPYRETSRWHIRQSNKLANTRIPLRLASPHLFLSCRQNEQEAQMGMLEISKERLIT